MCVPDQQRNLASLFAFSAFRILPLCWFVTSLRICGNMRNDSGHVVWRFDKSASFRIFDSAFYFPHSAIPHFTDNRQRTINRYERLGEIRVLVHISIAANSFQLLPFIAVHCSFTPITVTKQTTLPHLTNHSHNAPESIGHHYCNNLLSHYKPLWTVI